MSDSSKYFQAVAPTIYFLLDFAACGANPEFEVEGPLHPRCDIVAKPTLALVTAQMEVEDAEGCTRAEGFRNSLRRASLMIHGFTGDFSLYVVPFVMDWPDIGEPGALDRRVEMLANLSVEDFSTIQTAINKAAGVQEEEEKNSDRE